MYNAPMGEWLKPTLSKSVLLVGSNPTRGTINRKIYFGNMIRKSFKTTIINKRTKGLFRIRYLITLNFEDGRTIEKEVPESDFFNMDIQSELDVVMYSDDKIRWFFSPDEI